MSILQNGGQPIEKAQDAGGRRNASPRQCSNVSFFRRWGPTYVSKKKRGHTVIGDEHEGVTGGGGEEEKCGPASLREIPSLFMAGKKGGGEGSPWLRRKYHQGGLQGKGRGGFGTREKVRF